MEALLEAGSDPSTICLRGTSALHHAAEANRTDNLAAVLKHAGGSLVQATDEMGWTALHYAALHQLPESAALLIQARHPPAFHQRMLTWGLRVSTLHSFHSRSYLQYS